MSHLEGATVRIADPSDIDRILVAYEKWDYKGGIGRADTVWIAENSTELIGALRIVPEHGTLVLRAMRVADQWWGHGIGSQMLAVIAAWLGSKECYCISYTHLVGLYGSIGFIEVPPVSTPPFLAERLAEYRGRGLMVTILYRHPL